MILLRDRPEISREWYIQWLSEHNYHGDVDICCMHGADPRPAYKRYKEEQQSLKRFQDVSRSKEH